MIIRLIPRCLKDWVKAVIRYFVNASLPIATEPNYIPYASGQDAFFIPNNPSEHYDTCGHGLPIPPTPLFLGCGTTKEEYLKSGRDDTGRMLSLLQDTGFALREGARVLDFGCGAGRMLRHLHSFAKSCELWGMDISSDCVFWCKQYLRPPFLFATNTTIPHLPFEDRYFSLIYSGSVFTHIDDLALAWLLELRRILSNAGRLYVTIHDNHTVELLDGPYSSHWLAQAMKQHNTYNKEKGGSAILVVGRGTHSQVFYDIDYFCGILNAVYQVLSITPEAHGFHTGVVLARK